MVRRVFPRKKEPPQAEEVRAFARGYEEGYEKGRVDGKKEGELLVVTKTSPAPKSVYAPVAHSSTTQSPELFVTSFSDAPDSAENAAQQGSTQRSSTILVTNDRSASLRQTFSLVFAEDQMSDQLSVRLDAEIAIFQNCTMEPRTYRWGRSVTIPLHSLYALRFVDPEERQLDLLRHALPRLWRDFPGEQYSLMSFLIARFATLHANASDNLFSVLARVVLEERNRLFPLEPTTRG
jgi:hypothetical protein